MRGGRLQELNHRGTFKEEVQALIMEDSQFVQFRSYAMCGSTLLLRAFSYIVSSKVHKATIEII